VISVPEAMDEILLKKRDILDTEPYLNDQLTKKAEILAQPPLVLVVDDDETIIHLISALLTEINCDVISASNGLIALNILKEQAVDLVISDIIMPGMEGLELVRTVKRQYPDVSIISMSGFKASGQLDYLKHAQQFGADRVFTKPFEVQEFLSAVKELTSEQ